ncbi:MAG TPA: universal stress protein [Steroidobacteraceae bacterium]|nr:universal stress protein [Steroidobacteraceae bacterium]
MTTILVPIDGSEPGFRALDFAVRMLKGRPEGAIHALYVHPAIDVSGKVQIFVTLERMRELVSEQSRPILDRGTELLAGADVDHTVEMLEGDPAEIIARRAQELGCDAIIMGSRGMGKIANLVMGSVATKVVHNSPLPVTLIK